MFLPPVIILSKTAMIYLCHVIYKEKFYQLTVRFIKRIWCFLISSFRRVQNVVCFLLGDSPASELYMPTFRNTICSIFKGRCEVKCLPSKMEQIECSETSAYINQTPGNHPKENKQHSEHGESLKSRNNSKTHKLSALLFKHCLLK